MSGKTFVITGSLNTFGNRKELVDYIESLGGKVSGVEEYAISDGSGRTIVIVEKVKPTPAQFPRPSAKISKKPL